MQQQNGELNLENFFNIIKRYKWLILLFMLISTLLMALSLYFKPSIYTTSSILEIKSKSKNSSPNDFLLNALSFGGGEKIEKEIEILKTFLIHKEALKKVNFETKFYKHTNYKDVELYQDTPIKIDNIAIYNPKIINKKFIITPKSSGFTLSYETSLFNIFPKTNFTSLSKTHIYHYGEKIKTADFTFTVEKKRVFNTPLKFTLLGDKRRVYDTIISKKLSISQINQNAPLIKLSFEDSISKRAEAYLNAIMQSFIEQSINMKNEQNNKVLTFINKELISIRSKLERSEDRLKKFKIKNKITEPSLQSKSYIDKLSRIEIQISENLLKEKLLNNLIIYVKHNNNLDSIAPSLIELNDRPTLKLITSFQTLQLQEGELSTEFTNQYPKLINIRKQIRNIKRKILFNLQNLKASFMQKNSFLKEQKISYEQQIATLPTKEKKIVNIKRDYKVSSTMYDYLLKKKTESELLIVSTLSDYKIIDKAHTQDRPIKPKRALMLVVAPIIGLIVALILATTLHAFNNKLNNLNEIKELTDLSLYGVIPKLNQKDVNLEVYKNSSSPFSESFRTLRTNLPQKENSNLAKIIVVTSTIAGEGKTTTTANLASILQMAGHKTVVLSLDLRKPSLHNYFNLQNNKGMSSYLKGEDSLQEIVFATEYTNLHLIASGPIPNNPSELILSSRLTELLDILKSRYDYIVIDSAPIGLVSDSIPLMKIADFNLIITRENFTEKSFFEALHSLLKKNKIENVGLVLNASSSTKKAYGYGYGYGES